MYAVRGAHPLILSKYLKNIFLCKNILYTVIVVAHKDVATRCVLRAINASKCPSSQRSPDPLAGFEGGKGRERRERAREGGM